MNSRVEGVYLGKSVTKMEMMVTKMEMMITKMEMMMTKMEMMIFIRPSGAESIIVE